MRAKTKKDVDKMARMGIKHRPFSRDCVIGTEQLIKRSYQSQGNLTVGMGNSPEEIITRNESDKLLYQGI